MTESFFAISSILLDICIFAILLFAIFKYMSQEKRINYFLQSFIYLLGATLFQTNLSMRQENNLSLIENFGISFLTFGLMSWLLLTGILFLVEMKKSSDKKSNTTFYLGLGFLIIFLFL